MKRIKESLAERLTAQQKAEMLEKEAARTAAEEKTRRKAEAEEQRRADEEFTKLWQTMTKNLSDIAKSDLLTRVGEIANQSAEDGLTRAVISRLENLQTESSKGEKVDINHALDATFTEDMRYLSQERRQAIIKQLKAQGIDLEPLAAVWAQQLKDRADYLIRIVRDVKERVARSGSGVHISGLQRESYREVRDAVRQLGELLRSIDEVYGTNYEHGRRLAWSTSESSLHDYLPE